MKYILLLLLFSPFAFAAENEIDPLIVKKIDEIKNYSTIEGTWEGFYHVKSGPDAVFKVLKKDGVLTSGLGVRIIISANTKPKVFFKLTANSDWQESDGNINFVPDQLGWHIYIARDGGVWLERQWLSVARVKDKKAVITVTRTVHNWYGSYNENLLEHYYVFGSGVLNKI